MKKTRFLIASVMTATLIFSSISMAFAQESATENTGSTAETGTTAVASTAVDTSNTTGTAVTTTTDNTTGTAVTTGSSITTGSAIDSNKDLKQLRDELRKDILQAQKLLHEGLKGIHKSAQKGLRDLRKSAHARQLDPQDMEKQYEAYMADINAKLEQLKAEMQQQLEQVKELAELLKEKASVQEEAGDLVQAKDSLEQAVASDPADNTTYASLDNLYIQLGDKHIKVFVDGKKPNFDVPPVVKDNRTLIPLRAVTESMGAKVTWDPQAKQATIVKDGVTVTLKLGDKVAVVNGTPVKLDVPAQTVNSRTLVPLRFLGEAFKKDCAWFAESKLVVIK